MVPNVVTYCALISSCTKGKQSERALEFVLTAMEQQAVVPNVVTHCSLISAYQEGKQPLRAIEVFAVM